MELEIRCQQNLFHDHTGHLVGTSRQALTYHRKLHILNQGPSLLSPAVNIHSGRRGFSTRSTCPKANESNLLEIKNRSLYRLWSGDCGGELRENWLTGNRWQTAIKGSFADELKWDEMEVEQVCGTVHWILYQTKQHSLSPLTWRDLIKN